MGRSNGLQSKAITSYPPSACSWLACSSRSVVPSSFFTPAVPDANMLASRESSIYLIRGPAFRYNFSYSAYCSMGSFFLGVFLL